MTIAFRAAATVTNGTAGTSVTVARPTGTANGDFLLAWIGFRGTAAPTPPAGWTTLGVGTNASGPVSLGCYYKTAVSEPANWTWTIASAINFGLVEAYTGVDGNPIVDSNFQTSGAGTVFTPPPTAILRFGLGVSAAAAVRTASGTATTWTPSGTERADVSTNTGAGNDITGTAQDTLNPFTFDNLYNPVLTASQTQAQGVAWGLTLRAYFPPPKPGDVVPVIVEIAPGADLSANPNTWTWVDVTARATGGSTVRITRGRQNETAQTAPSTLDTFRLDNTDGWLTPHHPASPWYGQWGLDTPIRIEQRYQLGDFLRFQGYVDSISPDWPAGDSHLSYVDITASGRLRTLTNGIVMASPLTRRIARRHDFSTQLATPVRYYPFEDGSSATSVAEYFGGPPLTSKTAGKISFAADPAVPGSAPLAKLAIGTTLYVAVPTYPNTGSWCIEFIAGIPTDPGSDVNLLQFFTVGGSGSTNYWKVRYRASDKTIRLQALGPSGEIIGATGISFAGLFGVPVYFGVNAIQNGANMTWQLDMLPPPYTGIPSEDLGTVTSYTLGRLSQVTVAAGVGSDGLTFGQLAVMTTSDPFTGTDFVTGDWTAVGGYAGEDATTRIARVCIDENNITLDLPHLYTSTGHLMGSQPVASPISVLRECEAVDNGILADGLGPGLTYLPLYGFNANIAYSRRYNAPVALALDAARRHIKLDFRPVEDDQRTADDVTVSRSGGGSSGHFSVGAVPRYQVPVTLNTADDTTLVSQAAHRVALGQVPEMRIPPIRIDLRDTPELLGAWLRCDVGSRFTGTGLMTQMPPGGIDQVIEGYVEEFDGTSHVVTLHGFPSRPFRAATIADPTLGRLDTGGAYVAGAATTTTTGLTVATNNGQPWTTNTQYPGDFPHDADWEGEQVTVTAVAAALTDNFNRSTSSGLGTAPTGQTWSVDSGTAADFSTDGNFALMSHSSVNVVHIASVDCGASDFDFVVDFQFQVNSAVGAGWTVCTLGRYANASNYYQAQAQLQTNGTVIFQLFRRVAGVGGTLTTGCTLLGTNTATTWWRIRFQGQGSRLRGKCWRPFVDPLEPVMWQQEATDTTLTSGTRLALYSRAETGNTNTLPLVAKFDTLTVTSPQTVTVTRSVNGVTKTHPASSPIKGWRIPGLAL